MMGPTSNGNGAIAIRIKSSLRRNVRPDISFLPRPHSQRWYTHPAWPTQVGGKITEPGPSSVSHLQRECPGNSQPFKDVLNNFANQRLLFPSYPSPLTFCTPFRHIEIIVFISASCSVIKKHLTCIMLRTDQADVHTTALLSICHIMSFICKSSRPLGWG